MLVQRIRQNVVFDGPYSIFLRRATTLVLMLVVISTLLVLYQDAQNTRSAPKSIPLIVAWTPFFKQNLKQRLQPNFEKCRYKCEFIDREEYKANSRDADAYVMHGRDIISTKLPNQTSPHLNILFLLEPPPLSGPQIYQVPRNFFNATITYRTDSRYFFPYGYFVPLSVEEKISTKFEEQVGTSIPNDSFIALDDFKNVKQLGDYLNFLRNNDYAYKKYFHWRRHYRDPRSYRSDALCKLCEDIYNGTKLVIENIRDFYEKRQCI